MKLLRYTGQQAVSFMGLPYLGEVKPGEFEARDADADMLLLRTDIEAVDAEPAADPEPVAGTEAASAAKPRKASVSKSPEAVEPAVTAPTTTA